MIEIKETGGNIVFSVRVQPKAKSDRVLGEHAGALKVAVTAPPEKGKANAAVVALLSRLLGVPKSSIEIVRGETSRVKTLRVQGVGKDALLELLGRVTKGERKGEV